MSPEYARFRGFSIFLRVAERDLDEPIHVHVRRYSDKDNRSSKFWISPEGVRMANNKARLSRREIDRVISYLSGNRNDLIVWYMQVVGRI